MRHDPPIEPQPALPTAAAFEHLSLDGRRAVEQFLGKSAAEAQDLFHDNALCYLESLMWMGPAASRFYLGARADYLLQPRARGNIEAASGFIMTLDFFAETPDARVADPDRLLPAVERILAQFPFYAPGSVARRIYRGVPREARRVRRWLRALQRAT